MRSPPKHWMGRKFITSYHDSTHAGENSALTELNSLQILHLLIHPNNNYEEEIDLFSGYDITSKPSQVFDGLQKHLDCTDN